MKIKIEIKQKKRGNKFKCQILENIHKIDKPLARQIKGTREREDTNY